MNGSGVMSGSGVMNGSGEMGGRGSGPPSEPVGPGPLLPFQYVALRCVPRVEREEFVNVGVVLHCELGDFLGASTAVRADRLHALDPGLDLDGVASALATIVAVAEGEPDAWPSAGDKAGVRFRWIAAPRSTVVQPGPVPGGLTRDPVGELARLLDVLVR